MSSFAGLPPVQLQVKLETLSNEEKEKLKQELEKKLIKSDDHDDAKTRNPKQTNKKLIDDIHDAFLENVNKWIAQYKITQQGAGWLKDDVPIPIDEWFIKIEYNENNVPTSINEIHELDKPAKDRPADNNRFSPLGYAIYLARFAKKNNEEDVNTRIDIVKALLTIPGININDREHLYNASGFTFNGDSPLIVAARSGLEGIVESLLQLKDKIEINMTNDKTGDTALIVAVTSNEAEIVRLLLADPTIDINIQNKKGKTALDLARDLQSDEIKELIIAHRPPPLSNPNPTLSELGGQRNTKKTKNQKKQKTKKNLKHKKSRRKNRNTHK
jgi:ankyrin repeat protein